MLELLWLLDVVNTVCSKYELWVQLWYTGQSIQTTTLPCWPLISYACHCHFWSDFLICCHSVSCISHDRLWASRGFPPPGGIFYTIFFWNPNVSWAFFTCSAIWRLGRLWVIEVKSHQVHFWMWFISWSAINDYLVNLSQCVSPKWSQMV